MKIKTSVKAGPLVGSEPLPGLGPITVPKCPNHMCTGPIQLPWP